MFERKSTPDILPMKRTSESSEMIDEISWFGAGRRKSRIKRNAPQQVRETRGERTEKDDRRRQRG